MIYYNWFISEYTAATAHLSNEEDIAYRRLLDLSYDTEKPLNSQIDHLSRRVRCTVAAVESVLGEFFHQTDAGWVHNRVQRELEKTYAKSAKARESAKASHANRAVAARTHSERSAMAVRTQCDGSATQHSILNTQHSNKKSVQAPPVFPAVLDTEEFKESWNRYMSYRRQMGFKTLKSASVAAKFTEMAEWGHSQAIAALKASIANGWQGIFHPEGKQFQRQTQTVSSPFDF